MGQANRKLQFFQAALKELTCQPFASAKFKQIKLIIPEQCQKYLKNFDSISPIEFKTFPRNPHKIAGMFRLVLNIDSQKQYIYFVKIWDFLTKEHHDIEIQETPLINKVRVLFILFEDEGIGITNPNNIFELKIFNNEYIFQNSISINNPRQNKLLVGAHHCLIEIYSINAPVDYFDQIAIWNIKTSQSHKISHAFFTKCLWHQEGFVLLKNNQEFEIWDDLKGECIRKGTHSECFFSAKSLRTLFSFNLEINRIITIDNYLCGLTTQAILIQDIQDKLKHFSVPCQNAINIYCIDDEYLGIMKLNSPNFSYHIYKKSALFIERDLSKKNIIYDLTQTIQDNALEWDSKNKYLGKKENYILKAYSSISNADEDVESAKEYLLEKNYILAHHVIFVLANGDLNICHLQLAPRAKQVKEFSDAEFKFR